jgi:YD repeat-containing protein
MKKLILTRKLFLFALFIIATGYGYSQNNGSIMNRVSISSPNAASLGKYIDIPVNNHTGIPQISIPIYTFSEGTLSLPISLSYHAGGIKLSEIASWVGLGFSLNAGGVITRTVRGTPDECLVSEFTKNEKGSLGHNGYNNYLFEFEQGSPLPNQEIALFNRFNDGLKDGEPDLFTFNVNGMGGKFYFNDDGKPVMVPESDYKIEYYYNHAPTGPSSPKSIEKFQITVPDGTKYHFGKTDDLNDVDPIEKTHNYYTDMGILAAGTNNTIASWFLNKIVSADDKFSIILNYTTEEYSYMTLSDKQINSGYYDPTSSFNHKVTDHWVQGVRLTSITSSSNIVNFEPGNVREDLRAANAAGSFEDATNTETKTLGSIKITNIANSVCKKYNLTYSYFTSTATTQPWGVGSTSSITDLKRLKLDQIQEQSCDLSKITPPFVFDYFSEAMPRRLSFAQDHWGFMNGKTDNKSSIPTFVEKAEPAGTFNEIKGADRDTYWPAMRAGGLRKITYPTGGATEYEFEPNTTFVSYNTYIKIPSFTMSMGYDGNQSTVTQTRVFNSNPYSVKLINTNGGGQSNFVGASGLSTSALQGQTSTTQANVIGGSYSVSLSKSGATTGYGTEASIFEWIPTQVDENRIVGGLRIKKITQTSTLGTPSIITDYSYNESNGQSSGHLYSKPTYVQIVRNDFLRDAGVYVCCTSIPAYCSPSGFEICEFNSGFMPYLISSHSIRPMETTQGNHIGYNEIKISQSNNGYNIFRYYGSNVWDLNRNDVANRVIKIGGFSPNDIASYPEAPPVTDFKRGELKYQGTFNQANQIIKETYFIPEFTVNPLKTPALILGNGLNYVGLPCFYELSTAKKTKETILERTYQVGGASIESTTEKYYSSTYHNQLTRQTETNSKRDVLENKYSYPSDFLPSSCAMLDVGLNTYQTACVSCQTQYNQHRLAVGHNIAYWKYWDYQFFLKCKSVARINFFTARKNYYNPAILGSFANCLANAKTNAVVDLKPIYELQSKGIITPIEISTWKNGKLLSSAFSKYDYVTNPVNFPYPLKIQSIKLTIPTTSFTPSVVSGNTITKDSRYQDEIAVKFDNGNVVETLGKDDITTSYIWGYNNTLPIVKATGVSYTILKAAYDAVAGNLTTIRTQPSLSNAFINTYFYILGVGMTSETDPNGHSKYYEYDALNRLTLVRDQDNNILKKICYNYAGQVEDCPLANSTTAQWRATGNTRCQPCPADANYNSGIREKEEKDINPNSPTYTSAPRWVIDPSGTCPVLPNYQPNSFPVCQQNNGVNTGYLITTTADVNPCSNPPNQPGPPILTPSASCIPCNPVCTTPQYQCINGICVQGVLKVVKVRRISKAFWECTSAYCFPSSTGAINNDSYTIGSSTYTVVTTGTTPCEIECF